MVIHVRFGKQTTLVLLVDKTMLILEMLIQADKPVMLVLEMDMQIKSEKQTITVIPLDVTMPLALPEQASGKQVELIS